MTSTENHNIESWLKKIENNAKEFENVPVEIIDEDFIIQAIQRNSLTTRFIEKEYFNNDRIAFTIALVIENHKHLIKDKLKESDFYFNYVCQKIKSNEIDNSETYINKEFFSKKGNIIKVLETAGSFKLKHIHEDLKDDEEIVNIFCSLKKVNQIWASKRIQEEAAVSGVEVADYIKKKLFYKKMENKFAPKQEIKGTKI